MKYKSINFITNHLYEIIIKDSNCLIEKISQEHSLDCEEMKKKYIDNQSDIINNNIQKMLNSKIRCLGIIKSGCQCARTRKNNSEFCLIHQKSLKFGKKHNFHPNVDSPE